MVRLEEVELGDTGPGEVVVKLEASAMHIADIKLVQGIDALRRPLPVTPGFEGVGEVVETGADSGYEVGDRVFLPLGCGTFSEYVRVQRSDMGMRRAPEGDAEQLVLSNINGATAWTLLQDFVELKQGEWVLQDAANSNVGRYLIVLAAKWGFRTVNLVRREEVRGELMDLGADAVVLDGPDLPERIRKATGGAEIRLGIDAIAGEAVMRMADCLADGGLIVNYGTLTDTPCQIDFWQMFLHDIRLCGMSTTRCFAEPQRRRNRPATKRNRANGGGRAALAPRSPPATASISGGKRSRTPDAPAPHATARSSCAPMADEPLRCQSAVNAVFGPAVIV